MVTVAGQGRGEASHHTVGVGLDHEGDQLEVAQAELWELQHFLVDLNLDPAAAQSL